jgi:hypothetical protein
VLTATLAAGRERIAYSASVTGTGGGGAINWSANGLPGGLSINARTGAIAGTPSTAGTYLVTVTGTDATDASNSGAATLSLVVAAAVKVVSPRSLPGATSGVPYTYAVLAANVVGTMKWNLQGGGLPPGLTLNTTTGLISGVPTTKGTYSFNARVKDVNTDDTLTLTIVVK